MGCGQGAMNVKRLIFCTVIFIFVFMGTFILMFPYKDIVSSNLAFYAGRFMQFRDIDSGAFSTKIYGVDIVIPQFGRLYIGDLNVSYSPFSALTGYVRINIDSPYVSGVIKHKNGLIEFIGMLETSKIGKILGKKIPHK